MLTDLTAIFRTDTVTAADLRAAWPLISTMRGISMLSAAVAEHHSSIERFPKHGCLSRNRAQQCRSLAPRTNRRRKFHCERRKRADRRCDSRRDEKEGWKRTIIREKNGTTFVFGQSGVWNRFAYLLVHTALLIIFLGGFLTAQMGSTGQIPLAPGESSDLMRELVVDLDRTSEVTKRLPFEVICTDIQQKLIRNDGPISAGNTIDWLTHFQIRDETGTHDAFVQMNKPFDHRGYRFFQASFTHVGRARSITVRLTPESGDGHEDIIIPRNGAVTLPDGKTIRFSEFRGNLTSGAEDPFGGQSSYPNPQPFCRYFSREVP